MMSNKSLLIWSGVAVAVLTLFGTLFTFIMVPQELTASRQLDAALGLLAEGRWEIAAKIAESLSADELEPEIDAKWQYVMGVSRLRAIGKDLSAREARRGLRDATKFLREASRVGFPTGYTGQGNFHLGWCYYQTYHWQDAVEQLRWVPRQLPSKRSEALQMLVGARLRLTPPDLVGAQASLTAWTNVPGLSSRERARIKLAQADLALLMGQVEKCESLLTSVDSSSPEYFEALIRRGCWRLSAASQESPHESWFTTKSLPPSALSQPASTRSSLLNEVGSILREARMKAETPRDIQRQATLLSAKALLEQKQYQAALGTFSALRQADPETAEGVVAGIEEMNILLQQGQYEELLASARGVLRSLDDLSLVDERWLTTGQLKAEFLDLGKALRDLGEFRYAVRWADSLPLAFPAADALQLKSSIHQAWASFLENSPTREPETVTSRRDATKRHFLAAARGFERLSQLKLRSSEYTEILWQAIENYRRAEDYVQANELLRRYLQYEDRNRLPRGLLAMGKNFMELGDWDSALKPLQRCLLEFEDHPLSFEARLLAARTRSERNELEQAISLLESNTKLYDLRPENPVWQDSLFELGQLVFRHGDQLILKLRLNPEADWTDRRQRLEKSQQLFLTAMKRLGEAFARWPSDPRHYEARYYHARALRLAAELPTQVLAANPEMVDTARRKLLQQRRDFLEQARKQFRAVHQAVSSAPPELISQEKFIALLRNSYFGEADALFDLERWEEAIQAYQNVTARFINQPESLEALIQMAKCYRRLNRAPEAERLLNTAEQVLSRIPEEADLRFAAVTRGSRTDWARMIALMRP